MSREIIEKTFAENGTIEQLSDAQMRQGYDFLGDEPPSFGQFNFIQRQVWQGLQYLLGRSDVHAGSIAGKVNKETGKGLSSNDFSNNDKATLDSLASGMVIEPKSIESANSAILTGTYYTSGDVPTAEEYKVDVIVTGSQIIQTATKGDGVFYSRSFAIADTDIPAFSALAKATDVVDGDKTQHEINNILFNSLQNQIVIDSSISDISDIVNNAPSNTEIFIKNGNYEISNVNVQHDNVVLKGQSVDGVRIKVTSGASGLWLRFGKRGPSSDTRSDNLPVFNGTLENWDENEYSPSTSAYPRINGSGIEHCTLILSDDNGLGNATGLDFYRVDNPIMSVKIEYESKFAMSNAVRVWFCKDMKSDYLEVADNPNAVFNVLYYWSYGLLAGKWKIGAASTRSIDFKHSVNGHVDYLEAYGTGAVSSTAINVGYGSINNTFNNIVAYAGDVTFKSSVEFDVSKNIKVGTLRVRNSNAIGLQLIRVVGLNIDVLDIAAKSPIVLAREDFYSFSNASSIAPSKSSGEMVFDGNYFTTAVEAGFTKYYEQRPLPLLANAKFSTCDLVVTNGGTSAILAASAGGIVPVMDSNGYVRKFNNVRVAGDNEQYRTSYKYSSSMPHALHNVDFGRVTIKMDGVSSLTAGVLLGVPVSNLAGNLETYFNAMSFKSLWLFNSDITINTYAALTKPDGFVVELNSMVNSTIRGTFRQTGRSVNFIGGSAAYYKDGFKNHSLHVNFEYATAPLATPPIVTNFASSTDTWKHLKLKDCNIYALEGSAIAASAIIRHMASLPVGVVDVNGGGYIVSNCYIDWNMPFNRYYNTGTTPPVSPNFVNELSFNALTNQWYRAKSISAWTVN